MAEWFKIEDGTCDYFTGDAQVSLKDRIEAIQKALLGRIASLAVHTVYNRGAMTERGKQFTQYVNGLVISEGLKSPHELVAIPMSADAQITALQKCAEDHFQVVLANKPSDADILIWRVDPEVRRVLFPDGLHLSIYSRLTWDNRNA